MKRLNFIVIIFFSVITLASAQNNDKEKKYSQEDRKVVKEYLAAVEVARARVDSLQERGALKEVPYEKDDELVVEAEQLVKLIEEGTYVSPSKLKEMQRELQKIPLRESNSATSKWDNSIRRADLVVSTGEESIRNNRERLKRAKEILDRDLNSGKINQEEYNQREQRIRDAEVRIDSLEKKLQYHKSRVDSLRHRNNR